MESKALEKSSNSSVASRFFARILPMIRWIVKNCEIAERFLRKAVLIYPKNFLNFGSDMIVKQGIINLCNNSGNSYVLMSS